MIPDFPAAHSMDTNWFAIDADGNVAVFDSSENGAVPSSNREMLMKHQILELDDFFQYLPHHDNGIIQLKTPAVECLQGVTIKQLRKEIKEAKKASLRWHQDQLFHLLVIVTEEASIQKLDGGDPIFQFSRQPILVWCRQIPIKNLESLIESQEIIGGKSVNIFQNRHLLGLFSYDHPRAYTSPYERQKTPPNPLKLEDLPEAIQDSISWTWFDKLRFAEAEQIQPIEHTKCDTWRNDTRWFDTHGQEHEEHPH